MIEVKCIEYLSGKTSAESKVYVQRPKNVPEKYILIEKTGSSTRNMITTSTFAIQSIVDSQKGKTLLDAAELNEEVKTAMSGFVTEDEIIKCELNSDYNWTDSSTKEYRYQAVFDITHY